MPVLASWINGSCQKLEHFGLRQSKKWVSEAWCISYLEQFSQENPQNGSMRLVSTSPAWEHLHLDV